MSDPMIDVRKALAAFEAQLRKVFDGNLSELPRAVRSFERLFSELGPFYSDLKAIARRLPKIRD